MTAPEQAARDPARLAALDGYGILDTPAEQGFDDIVLLASRICGTPVAQSASSPGTAMVQGPRRLRPVRDPAVAIGLRACPPTAGPAGHLRPDQGPRTWDNPLVTGEPRLRFYAGARLETPDGMPLGTLCGDRRDAPAQGTDA